MSLDGVWKYAARGSRARASRSDTPTATWTPSSWPDMELPTNWYLTEVGDFFGTIWFRRTFRGPGRAPRAAAVPAVRRGRLLRRRLAERRVPRVPRGHVQPVRVRRHRPASTTTGTTSSSSRTALRATTPSTSRSTSPTTRCPCPYRTPPGDGDRSDQGPHDRRDAPARVDDVVPVRRQLGRHLGQRRADRPAPRVRRPRQGVHEDRRAEGLARRPARQARRHARS